VKQLIRQLSAVCGVNVRDDLMRPINPLVAVAGAAGTAFVLVAILAVAEGLNGVTERAGSASTALIVSRDASVEMSSGLSEEDRAAAVDLIGDRSLRRDAISAELVRTMDTISRGGEAGSQVIGRALGPEGIRLRPKFQLVAGRMFRSGTLEVIVGRRLARDFAGLSIGETVTGSAQEWRIVGIFEEGGGIGESEVWSDLESARMESGSRSGVSSLRLPMASDAELQALRSALDTNPRLQLQVVRERQYQASLAAKLVARVRSLAFALTLLLGIGAVVATINTTYSSIMARERCLSTLRAIGFSNVSVAAAVFLEALMLGFAGGAAGGIIAWSVVSGWSLSLLNTETHTPVALDAAVTLPSLAYGVVSGIALGALAAVLPSISVAKKDIAVTLRA
jgi:putative ABC transport system permease protein